MKRDHTFLNPRLVSATVAYDPAPVATFAVLAPAGHVDITAKICYVSWMLGPGRKIILGHGDEP